MNSWIWSRSSGARPATSIMTFRPAAPPIARRNAAASAAWVSGRSRAARFSARSAVFAASCAPALITRTSLSSKRAASLAASVLVPAPGRPQSRIGCCQTSSSAKKLNCAPSAIASRSTGRLTCVGALANSMSRAATLPAKPWLPSNSASDESPSLAHSLAGIGAGAASHRGALDFRSPRCRCLWQAALNCDAAPSLTSFFSGGPVSPEIG